MENKILSGVPAPEQTRGAPVKYDFSGMKPGDHKLHKCRPGEDPGNVRRSIITTAKQRGYSVRCRTQGNIIKVWLVEKVEK